MSFKRLSRSHARFAAATLGLGALGSGAVAILAHEPDPGAPASPVAASPRPALSPQVSLPPVDAPEPPERAAGRRPPHPDLPPLGRAWRQAVIESRRDQVMAGARALRQAPDAKAQLLLLIKDPEPRVRAFAMRELGRRRDPTLEATFRAYASDSDRYVAENARWGLEQLAQAAGPQPPSPGGGR